MSITRVLWRDPSSIKFVVPWIKSLSPFHNSLVDQVPWITFEARAWLESYLKPDMSVFEYGSGGSTLFISTKVRKLVSIEHHKGWYDRISSALSEKRISNCECVLSGPEKGSSAETPPYGPGSYTSEQVRKERGLSFEKYVRNIDKCPDESLDLVIVDGRARASCMAHSLKKIRTGGYLMLDDSERKRYQGAISTLTDYNRTDFFGFTPYTIRLRRTTVWEIKR